MARLGSGYNGVFDSWSDVGFLARRWEEPLVDHPVCALGNAATYGLAGGVDALGKASGTPTDPIPQLGRRASPHMSAAVPLAEQAWRETGG